MINQFLRLIIFATAATLTTQTASAQSAEQILPRNTFFLRATANWNRISGATHSTNELKEGETGFLPLSRLIRGQDEISVDNMYAKLDEKLSKGDVVVVGNSVSLAHDSGRSSVPLNDPIDVIKGPLGYLIRDGHHDVFLALALSAQTISATVGKDYSHLSVEEFWKKVREEEAIYLRASNQELVKNPPQMMDITDNPNRYAASLIALKAKVENDQVRKIKGPKKPVWVKVGSGVPFIEFYIAKALSEAGFSYRSEWGNKMPKEAVESARSILLAAKQTSKYPQLRTLIVLKSREEAEILRNDESLLGQRIKAEAQVEKHVRCEMSFGA